MRRVLSFVAGAVLLLATPTFAQDNSRGEVSAGWRYYHAAISSVPRPFDVPLPNDFSKGWFADAALNLSPKFAIVGEAGGSYHTDEFSRTQNIISTQESLEVTFHTFMGGLRIRAPQNPRIVPFGQILFGGEHDSSVNERTFTVFQNTSRSSQERAFSSPVLALESGATIKAGIVGVRASVGYVRFFGSADADAFRLSLGGVYRF